MKIFPYIPIGLRDDYINRITEYIKDLDNRYNKLLNILKKIRTIINFLNFQKKVIQKL